MASAFCDADGEYDPAELERLVAPVLAGEADYVVGSRFAGGPRSMRAHRSFGKSFSRSGRVRGGASPTARAATGRCRPAPRAPPR
ncbi:MAG: glycosyltransferase [Microthrixaceae bacterium]|nr:glycosyltransferase [Microthrixaceae bacterium]